LTAAFLAGKIAAMAEATTRARRIAPATIVLILAALLALTAIVIRLARSDEADSGPAGNQASPPQAGSMDGMIASLSERLRQEPDNDRGWFMLGMTYRGSERFAEAAQAFRRAVELNPRNADYAAYLGEALILGSSGNPPPEAERLFRRALELQPGNPQARYYLATLKDLGGDHRGAVDDLVALLREAPAGAPWEPQVRDAVTAIARQHRIDLANRLPPPAAATAAIPGPTPEQMAAARAIPPGQQDQMVRAMVDGLAARLRQNPRDADGWIRLMRSRMVLHEPDAAAAVLRSALAAFPGDTATQSRLRGAARELGVP
jgi:cytochrome c-type biogenesis protein CcmH